MISVTVKLFPPLRDNRFSQAMIKINEPATVASLMTRINIKEEHVEGIYINSREAGFDHALHDGDNVSFLPFIGGG